MTEIPFWFFLLALWGYGLLFGSFANVVIWRFPREESLSTPPSHCPACGARIAWYDNVPVVSWLVLGARCRSCSSKISARYPAVEAMSGFLWLAAGLAYGISLRTAFAVVFLYVLMILTFIDLDHRRLPNKIVALLGVVGAVGLIVQWQTGTATVPLVGNPSTGVYSNPGLMAMIGVLLGGGLSFAVAGLYSVVRGRTGLGMGDVKLLGVMGLFLGPYVLLALLVGSVVGAVYGLLFERRGEDAASVQIPFGPFLATGALVSTFYGPLLWATYARIIGVS